MFLKTTAEMIARMEIRSCLEWLMSWNRPVRKERKMAGLHNCLLPEGCRGGEQTVKWKSPQGRCEAGKKKKQQDQALVRSCQACQKVKVRVSVVVFFQSVELPRNPVRCRSFCLSRSVLFPFGLDRWTFIRASNRQALCARTLSSTRRPVALPVRRPGVCLSGPAGFGVLFRDQNRPAP